MANKLLLADDSPTIAKILGMALQSENYEIRSVLTAEDAEKELRNHTPNFFLVDLTLPGKNGYEFAAMIRKDSKLKNVKVVLLSSAFDPADPEQVEKCGADGVIEKPFDPSDLREKLRNFANVPVKYPKGSHVAGAVSGTEVLADTSPENLATSPSFPTVQIDPLELQTRPTMPAADPNDILSSALGGAGDPAESPGGLDLLSQELGGLASPEPILSTTTAAPEAPHPLAPRNAGNIDDLLVAGLPPSAEGLEERQPTLQIDLSGGLPPFQPEEQILDLSASFSGGSETPLSPPPGKLPAASPLSEPKAAKPQQASQPATGAPSLSANAQALAAFFEAEIDSKGTPPAGIPAAKPAKPMAPPPIPPSASGLSADGGDSFDASLESIDWSESPKNLNAWSSSSLGQTKKPAPPAAPPAAPKVGKSAPSGASSGETSFIFDVGGSNFRFAEDYIHRITKSFTGSPDEMILGKDPSPPKPNPIFPKASSDAQTARPRAELPSSGPTPTSGGRGAWTPEEESRIEQLVKEEVQMVVREIAEKVAWEVIPELAENIIRKELDKVLKEMEE
jgi:DNA-binding response OmpR family regulator